MSTMKRQRGEFEGKQTGMQWVWRELDGYAVSLKGTRWVCGEFEGKWMGMQWAWRETDGYAVSLKGNRRVCGEFEGKQTGMRWVWRETDGYAVSLKGNRRGMQWVWREIDGYAVSFKGTRWSCSQRCRDWVKASLPPPPPPPLPPFTHPVSQRLARSEHCRCRSWWPLFLEFRAIQGSCF